MFKKWILSAYNNIQKTTIKLDTWLQFQKNNNKKKIGVMHYSLYVPFSEGSPELAAMEGTGAKNCINN